MTVSLTEGTATIGTTEYSLVGSNGALTPQTGDCYISVRLDLSNLAAGDVFKIRVYEEVNSGSSTALEPWTVTGLQIEAIQLPLLMVGGGWDVTVQKTAGTDRSISWTVEKETSEITLTDDAATIGSTEYSLPGDAAGLTAQADDVYLQPWISFANLATGDRFRIRVYEKMNSAAARPILDRCVDHAQSRLWTCPIALVGGGWDVTLTKVSGTDRSIAWSLRTDPRTGSGIAPSYPQLSNATTEEDVRDRIIAIIVALDPTLLAGDRFRAFRNEGAADFIAACEATPAGMFRRFQVIGTGADEPPPVSNTDHEERQATFQVLVCYPHTARYGADQALDRHDVMKSDQHQIEHAIGLHGRGNFIAPNPDACWRGGSTDRIAGTNCDFLVITQVMSWMQQFI